MSEPSKAARESSVEEAKARNRSLQMPSSVDNSKVIGGIDAEIARRLRALRIKTGLSQTVLGQKVGVSYQQMQKYEHGRDRIAASTIQRFASALGVQAGWFFEKTIIPDGDIHKVTDSLRIAGLLQKVSDPIVQKRLLALIRSLAGEEVSGHRIVQKRLMALADSIAEMHLAEAEQGVDTG